ncbi:MAG: hypothetical protein ACHQ53_09480 [Polyangiales bacterium]
MTQPARTLPIDATEFPEYRGMEGGPPPGDGRARARFVQFLSDLYWDWERAQEPCDSKVSE